MNNWRFWGIYGKQDHMIHTLRLLPTTFKVTIHKTLISVLQFWTKNILSQLWGVKPLVEGMSMVTRTCNMEIERLTIYKLHGRNSNIVTKLIWIWIEVEESALDVFDMAFMKVSKEKNKIWSNIIGGWHWKGIHLVLGLKNINAHDKKPSHI